MTAALPGRLRVTVLGCSTAVPHPSSPAAGYLVEWDGTAVLLDAGQGVVRRLEGILDPSALSGVIVGHMHADHYLDLVGLRYLFPWAGHEAEPGAARLPVHLPPGGRDRLDALAVAISERAEFFADGFAVGEYDPESPLEIGPLTVRFIRARHYVPAWGLAIEAPDGARIVYTGDTGPSEEVIDFARRADLLLVEAALVSSSDDDPERGHLTVEEAIELATRAAARWALVVHYAPGRHEEIEARCEATGSWIRPAVAGLTRTVSPPSRPAAAAALTGARSGR
jgi:ribonuclease BN (tRNA processing enzyme)